MRNSKQAQKKREFENQANNKMLIQNLRKAGINTEQIN